jgi:hypothetical protein
MALTRQGGRYDYKYKEFTFDTVEGLETVNVNDCCPGSTAFIISTSQAFILSEQGKWEEI